MYIHVNIHIQIYNIDLFIYLPEGSLRGASCDSCYPRYRYICIDIERYICIYITIYVYVYTYT